MKNGKQSEQLLEVLGGHSASLDRTSKCRGLSEQPLYSGGHKAMQHETRNWNNFDKCEPEQQYRRFYRYLTSPSPSKFDKDVYFSKIDLSKRLWQIPVAKDCRHMTAFTTTVQENSVWFS